MTVSARRPANQPSLLERVPDTVDPVSIEHWRRIQQTLTPREESVMGAIYDLLAEKHWTDVSGGELAYFTFMDKTSVRPRLTGLHDKGYLERTAVRSSRAPKEGRCHGYRPTLTRAAWERGRA